MLMLEYESLLLSGVVQNCKRPSFSLSADENIFF